MTETAAQQTQSIDRVVSEVFAEGPPETVALVKAFVNKVFGDSDGAATRSRVPISDDQHRDLGQLRAATGELYNLLDVLTSEVSHRPGRACAFPARYRTFADRYLERMRSGLASIDVHLRYFDTQSASSNVETLVREIYSLIRRGGKIVNIGNNDVAVAFTTTDCILRNTRDPGGPEINFGPFTIEIKASLYRSFVGSTTGGVESYFCAHPQRLAEKADNERAHPHVSNSKMCLGDGRTRTAELLRQGYVDEAVVIIDTVLHTYGSSPFFRIESFYPDDVRPYNCRECGATIRPSDEGVEPCDGGGYLCEGCGFYHTRREVRMAGRHWTCPACEHVVAASERVVISTGEICETCARESGATFTRPTQATAPARQPAPVPTVQTFRCQNCQNERATQRHADSVLGFHMCEQCSSSIGGFRVSNDVINHPNMFITWMLVMLQTRFGHDRSGYVTTVRALDSPDARRAVVERMIDADRRGFLNTLRDANGDAARLSSIIGAINRQLQGEVLVTTPEASDVHDTVFVDRILFHQR